jgi:hypothetical protein
MVPVLGGAVAWPLSAGALYARLQAIALRGVAYAFDHPEEAIAIMRKTNPEVAADSAGAGIVLRHQKAPAFPSFRTSLLARNRIGPPVGETTAWLG